MGKISVPALSRKRRSNSIQTENELQEAVPVKVKRQVENCENSVSEPNPNQSAGLNVFPPSTPTSIILNTSASDGSHVFSPSFCQSSVEQITINGNFVIAPDTRERKAEPQAQIKQEALAQDIDASATTILRTPKKSRKSRRNRRSATRRSLILGAGPIEGEITGAHVTSEYRCSDCRCQIPSWKPSRFQVRCPECRTSWRCDKIQCSCKAKVTLEQAGGRMGSVTLEDSVLHSIVSFKRQGYCRTEGVEKKLLKLGRVRVAYSNGVASSVTKISSSSTPFPGMPGAAQRDSD